MNSPFAARGHGTRNRARPWVRSWFLEYQSWRGTADRKAGVGNGHSGTQDPDRLHEASVPRNAPPSDLYIEVEASPAQLELEQHCKLIRATSSEAARLLGDRSVGVLHIDGNHDEARLREDVGLYLPKITHRGILVLDDVSYATVRPSKHALEQQYSLIYEEIDDYNDFAIFSIA